MKILWVKSDFLHPTNRGGQIRTLEMLRCLNRRHEVHFIAFDDGKNPEGLRRSSEYCSRAYAVPHRVPSRRSLRFAGQLVEGLVSRLPVSVRRYTSGRMKRQIQWLLEQNQFDSLVCDFLFPAMNIPDLSRSVLFQHNVESVIWRRHVQQASGPAKRAYFRLQARRMEIVERAVCRKAGQIVAVSEVDRDTMRKMFSVERVTAIPTGVDVEFFTPPPLAQVKADLVFVGSMDWMPNIDAMRYFTHAVLPLIRKERPNCRLAIAGRKPGTAIQEMARRDPNISVTGTVADIRPYLWGSTVCVVPLRVGGGTRLKIFEAMAARVPVVSTSIGAEGLPVEDGVHICLADSAEPFAQRCLELLNAEDKRKQLANQAWELVSSRFSWEAVAREFETILANGPRPMEADH